MLIGSEGFNTFHFTTQDLWLQESNPTPQTLQSSQLRFWQCNIAAKPNLEYYAMEQVAPNGLITD